MGLGLFSTSGDSWCSEFNSRRGWIVFDIDGESRPNKPLDSDGMIRLLCRVWLRYAKLQRLRRELRILMRTELVGRNTATSFSAVGSLSAAILSVAAFRAAVTASFSAARGRIGQYLFQGNFGGLGTLHRLRVIAELDFVLLETRWWASPTGDRLRLPIPVSLRWQNLRWLHLPA